MFFSVSFVVFLLLLSLLVLPYYVVNKDEYIISLCECVAESVDILCMDVRHLKHRWRFGPGPVDISLAGAGDALTFEVRYRNANQRRAEGARRETHATTATQTRGTISPTCLSACLPLTVLATRWRRGAVGRAVSYTHLTLPTKRIV